jgi:hypothetical protein
MWHPIPDQMFTMFQLIFKREVTHAYSIRKWRLVEATGMRATLPDFTNTEPRMDPDEQEPFAVRFKTPHLLPLPPLSLSSSGIASESFPQ